MLIYDIKLCVIGKIYTVKDASGFFHKAEWTGEIFINNVYKTEVKNVRWIYYI